MSDAPQGPGWWLGQDGKYYPPSAVPGQPRKQSKTSGLGKVIVLIGLLFIVFLAIAALTSPKKDPATTAAAPSASTTTATTVPLTPEQIDAAVATEVKRACDDAVGQQGTPVVRFDPAWVGKKREDVQLAALVCAQQARDAYAADIVSKAQTPDVDAIVRNPSAFTGQPFVMIVKVEQADSATGACAFRASWDNTVHEYSYEYKGDNAVFVGGNAVSECPMMTGIDKDDVARVWVTGLGTIDYGTQLGGQTTVPQFRVIKSEVLQKL